MMPDCLCTRMGKQRITGVHARNFVAHSASPELVFALVTTRAGTTGRRTEAALNTELFPRITGFPLTAVASISRERMSCARSARDITPALRHPGRNDYGCATEPARQTSTRWPIFLLWLLLLLLFCPALTPTAHLNHSGEALNACSYIVSTARFSTGSGFYARFLFDVRFRLVGPFQPSYLGSVLLISFK